MQDERDDRIHRAAAAGNLTAVLSLLASPDPPAANAPDQDGRTAAFYAQMNGHLDVVDALARNGWTRMPEGLIFSGPGGRKCFWSWCSVAPAPQQCERKAAKLHYQAARPMGEASERRAADAKRRRNAVAARNAVAK